MASALYSEDLTCSICLTLFTDPVTLPCGHSFCRGCVTAALSAQELCPQCRTAVPTEGRSLPTSHILKSLSEKAKDAERRKTEQSQQKTQVAELCPEHEEKLKLFCVTDQLLACIICRDEEKHDGHKFKPIKEAAAALRQELEKWTENLCSDVSFTESLADSQREEITKTKAKSQQLMTQIHRQFEEMHQFLRKREDEIKNELKLKEEDAAEKMSKNLKVLETALCESRELEGKLASVMKIEDPEKFLKRWTEGNSRMTPEKVFQPRATDLQVVRSSLCLGPYESHLQFFMWKEMLQVIQPRAELLSLKSNSKNITVSDDGRTLFCTTTSNQAPSGSSSGFHTTTGSGQRTGFSFDTGKESDQRTGFSFGTATSDQRTGFSFGTATSDQRTGFSFGTGKESDQRTGFSFGTGKESDQRTGFSFGTGKESDQRTGFSFGTATSDQRTGFSFGTGKESDQRTGFSFGTGKESDQRTGFSFGTATSDQRTGFSFGTGKESDQRTGFSFGTGKESDQRTGFSFGTATSDQRTGFSFGTGKESDQRTGFSFGTAKSGQKAGFNFGSSSTNHAFSVNEFTFGQHYWEIEVGHRDYWELGIKKNFLKYNGQKYFTCVLNKTTDSDLDSDSHCDSEELVFGNRPRKIGIYLNCTSKKLSFYDADNMKHIHTVSSSSMSMPLSAYFNIRATECDHSPLTVCWY
ncbi:nuclear factor 7, brain-like isoform X2 [Plectropomus leopardus]|uniref:nuclear factor 7, brain-like isoform X2 n=1 Tax=Plectropomus leopardus TaxID=160734 RepID=UPI001C4C453D|nr:nuclear factor 7, brain-like isoform X2 [Plectropomus leopardus]